MGKIVSFLLFLTLPLISIAQQFVPNYDEAKVPTYKLPDPLIFKDGSAVKSKKDWSKRRGEIYHIFEKEVFGVVPEWKGFVRSTLVSLKEDELDGIAKRKEVRLDLINGDRRISVMILIYLPHKSKNAPIFLSYNFDGNHTITTASDVTLPDSWVSNSKEYGITNNKANESGRGEAISRWPLRDIISRGFGVATVYYGDVDPDFNDGFKNGVHRLFDSQRDSTSWGSIAAWAWGLSRVMDYFETDKEINSKRVIVMGHSRLGKAALWAGASDKRFAITISNNSGCGGAAISRRKFGETVGKINSSFPYWFCDNFKKYNNNEDSMPIDQHELIALIAPRPVYVASAAEDLWADPKGEFLSCVNASPVYKRLLMKGFPAKEMPALNKPVFGNISYHIRSGKHDITLYDWQCYMDFAVHYFKFSK
ncbi:MAG: acetylxylan esterase [Bacteroidia bacterium]|nr:acetylxylan esterase [Bacteroidia bacterium]